MSGTPNVDVPFFQQIQEGQQIFLILNLLSSLNLLEMKFRAPGEPSAVPLTNPFFLPLLIP
jgi:hypothetical protein